MNTVQRQIKLAEAGMHKLSEADKRWSNKFAELPEDLTHLASWFSTILH